MFRLEKRKPQKNPSASAAWNMESLEVCENPRSHSAPLKENWMVIRSTTNIGLLTEPLSPCYVRNRKPKPDAEHRVPIRSAPSARWDFFTPSDRLPYALFKVGMLQG